MSIQVQCSHCHKVAWMQHCYHRKHCDTLNIQSRKVTDFNKVYICCKCRNQLEILSSPTGLHATKEYKTFQSQIQTEVNEWVRRGTNDPVSYQNFRKNIECLLDKALIKHYSLDIRNGELFGIVLKQIPFFGDILLKINLKGR